MFSREDVSTYINENFEPAWEMVRPVPIIHIDFGNGRETTRTLHGNVASYVCGGDGHIVDILPGIYTPATYLAALHEPRNLANELRPATAAAKLARLRTHHRTLAENPRPVAAPPARAPERDIGKKVLELPIERNIQPNRGGAAAPRPRTAADLASWQPLVADTNINETLRRRQIHQNLAASDLVRPEQIKRWLYREVLQADLDDPLMGLGDDLFEAIER